MGKLNPKQVENLAEPGTYEDGDGLRLAVKATGRKSWVLRFQLNGKRREMGLGSFPGVSLKAARLAAADQRKLLAAGADPMAARDAERERQREVQRQQEAKGRDFKSLATEYMDAHGASWSDKWRKGWMRKLELYAFPVIGKLPASAINTEHILQVLKPIWATKTRTADEVRGQLEAVLGAAKTRKLRDGDNPALWRGNLENLLGRAEKKKARKRQHFPAMSWRDVPGLMVRLAQSESRDALAARLLILTGARSHMVRFAAWSELDLAAGVWSLPADRMKMGQAFDIPLPAQVVELLKAMPRIEGSPYLFPGQGKTGVMHANAVRNLLHGLGHDDITRHGFRSSFRDWANDCTDHPREVCELALAHDERDQTEGAYSRSDFFEKRRALMADWAQYATTPPAANVIQGDFKRAEPSTGQPSPTGRTAELPPAQLAELFQKRGAWEGERKSKTAQTWGSPAKALPLADVACMLGVEPGEMGQLVAESRLSVCVIAPPQLGVWRVSGLWDEVPRHARQFPGRYARLSTREAIECLTSEWITVYSLNLEPASLEQYADDRQTVCTPGTGTAEDGIRIQASDLLVSQVEYERYLSANPAINIPNASDAALGAEVRQQRSEFAALGGERKLATADKHQRWIDTAEEIQAGRARKASKRKLAELVQQRLDLSDSVETIRKVLPG